MASLKRNVIANYVGKSWSAVLGIVLVPVYIKFVGIEAYGLVGFSATLASVMSLLNLGFGATINRELAKRSVLPDSGKSQRDLVRTLETIYWGIAIFSGVIVIFGASFITNSWINIENLDSNVVLKSIQLMGISVALRFPMALYQGGLMGLQKQVLVNGILIANGTLRGIGAVLVLWLISPSIYVFFAWQAFTSLTGSLALFVAVWKSLPKSKARPKFRFIILKEVWKYAAAMSVSAIVGVVLSQLDKIILSKMLPLKIFAYYTIATTVASAVWMIIIPFNQAIFPKLVQLYEERKKSELINLFHISTQVLSLILLPVSGILIFYSKEILTIWLDDPTVVENAYLIMSLLVTGTMLNGLATIPSASAPAFGWPMLVTYTNLLQAIIIIPLIIIMVYWLEAIGAAISWIVMNSTYLVFMTPIFFKRHFKNEKWRWYINDIGIPLLLSFCLCFLSKALYVESSSKLVMFCWLCVTGFIVLILTGLSMPQLREMGLKKIKYFGLSKGLKL